MTGMLTYIIADDDAVYRELTVQQLNLIPGLECLSVCENAIEVIRVMGDKTPDLLVLDVEMPGLSGIQLAKSLKILPLIIFVSSHKHYAADAFDVDAIDYLVKPVAPERLIRALEKARMLADMKKSNSGEEAFKAGSDDSFFIKDKNAFVRVDYSSVLYIESMGDFVNIFLDNGAKKIALVSMKNMEQQLPASHFIRISRSHMVNKQKITALDSSTVSLGKLQLHIGKTYADTLLQAVIGNAVVRRFI